jgi:hypothetical protein
LSHEVSEAITDPDTQTGWFDRRNGEIGDIAEGHIEHDTLLVRNNYRNTWGGAQALRKWPAGVNSMQHGVTSEQIAADFLGSQEYFQAHNASTGDWLSSIYQNVLSRQPDQSGYQSWLTLLSQQ